MRNYLAWSRFIESREKIPFAWDDSGQDCIRFGTGAALALTGIDRLAGLKPWNSKGAALMQIGRIGKGAGLEAAISTRFRPVAPALAHRGDLAGVEDAELGVRMMVVEGAMLVGPGTYGLIRTPRSDMVCAWSAD